MALETDFIVVGSGIAGLRAAIEIARSGARVTVLTKDRTSESNTEYAQGGIAVALSDDDEIELHLEDTLAAGAGLCDTEAVRVMVEDGPRLIQELIDWGTDFDRERGNLVFTREAAHSRRRILHAQGDSTGHEIVRSLIAKTRTETAIKFVAHAATQSLLVANDKCCGVRYVDPETNAFRELHSRAVVLATGGAGQLFQHTTNPDVATGDGFAMAYAAGAEMADMEFVQFHPTALNVSGAPRFLLSEAMRGEGGILKNDEGERFMARYHERGELAPRDIVSRSIVAEMKRTGANTVYLDMTALKPDYLRDRFPKIYSTCLHYGLDITKDLLPVSPAAHYCMGGVRTNLSGCTTLPGLYAAGEVACTGVHGANRLASNSLLEGLVFGARAGGAAAIEWAAGAKEATNEVEIFNAALESAADLSKDVSSLRNRVRVTMWDKVGILRNGDFLENALTEFKALADEQIPSKARNFLNAAMLVTRAALWREESRGAHFRMDFPEADDKWRVHSIIQRDRSDVAQVEQLDSFTNRK
jgi:L-aspartate oxidase